MADIGALSHGQRKGVCRMKKIRENIANLFKVKTIITLAVITVFVALALRGSISPDNVMIIVTSVISFYFGTQYERRSGA